MEMRILVQEYVLGRNDVLAVAVRREGGPHQLEWKSPVSTTGAATAPEANASSRRCRAVG
jgi:hypothetical protein